MKNKLIKLTLLLPLVLLGCKEQLEQQVSLEEKIGQMIMVGFRGKVTPDYLKEDLKEGRIGGVVLFDYDIETQQFDRNIETPDQVKALISEIKHYARTPVFISIDQEGGVINRLRPEYGFPKTLSAQELGNKNDLNLTYENALTIAKTLKDLGINVNFAPVVDLNVNPNNPAIGKKERSYSANPEIVYAHAKQVIKAHKQHNILTALKHFPGHGSAWNDSHNGFVDLSDTYDEVELVPYQKLINDGQAYIAV
ncbi:glycoside hydrolase family 3 N-terminal domain-containing protein [Pseudomonadota bacterium]